jgi:hypothetical protein
MRGDELILVTGATGYIGGRLVPRLLEAGYRVRCLVRDPQRLQGQSWTSRVEVVSADALEASSLAAALQGVHAAYYLIHGLQGGKLSAEHDLQMARNFALAAESMKLPRQIYLGELVDPTAGLSPYLRSRHETGYVLRQSGVPVTEFRAGMIIGSGSALFEMIRYLTERPSWCARQFFALAQPIAVRDVLVISWQPSRVRGRGKPEIGGPALTYRHAVGYARERGKLLRSGRRSTCRGSATAQVPVHAHDPAADRGPEAWWFTMTMRSAFSAN